MFGFQPIERKVYEKNFLRKVFFQLNFNSCKNLKENSQKVEELFKDSFPRFGLGKGKGFQISIDKEKTNFQHIEQGDNISLKSIDGQKQIIINETGLNFSVEGIVYKSYESIQDDLARIIQLLKICDVVDLTKISLRKLNIIEFKGDENPNGILDFLLNKALVNSNDAFPNMKLINHNIHSVNFINKEYSLNLKYGMNVLPILENKIGQLIIDMDIAANKNIPVDNILSESRQINDEIFNVFNWVINENAKRIILNAK